MIYDFLNYRNNSYKLFLYMSDRSSFLLNLVLNTRKILQVSISSTQKCVFGDLFRKQKSDCFLIKKQKKLLMGAITAICSDQKQDSKKTLFPRKHLKQTNKPSFIQSKQDSFDSTIISSLQSAPHSPLSASTPIKNDQRLLEEQQMDNQNQGKKHLGISNFDFIGELGSGNFGKVYKVILNGKSNEQTHQAYALKKMSRKQLSNKKSIQNLKLQRQILINGNHQFLTNLKFSFADEDNIYFVMDCAEGGSVDTLLSLNKIKGSKKNLREKKFRELGQSGVKFITASVILGLEELHKHNIMYRDLKPENILIFSDGYIKLADFGLSKILENSTKTSTQAGTVNYFAPEVVMRTGYTKLIDFWTLGVFIYELATSDSPFRHDEILTRSTFKEKVERAEVDRDWKGHSLNEELKDLINKLLKFKPEQRLGAKGFDEIKSHSFFKDIDWLKLLNKQMESPILPLITEHPIKISALKNKGFIKKTISFDFEKDQEWMYDFHMKKSKSQLDN